mmetsp:Transcript_6284/g.17512  ORF Transcript_6284/g.17512 Transcript_6284/m.17512 type:complete len:245 (-) Transcript_6284:104-838(-)
MAGCCPPNSWPALKTSEAYTRKGEVQKIGELDIYVVGEGKKGILILPDIFGWSAKGGRFFGIADTLADKGYFVVVSDPFYGDTADGKPDIVEWIKTFPYEDKIGRDIEECVKFLETNGCEAIGFAGFCWGMWAGCRAASLGVPFKCGVGAHPSTRLEGVFGGSEQDMMEKVKCPILLMPAGNDPDNLKDGGSIAQAMVVNGGATITFADMTHGWVCRGDLSDAMVRRDVEAAIAHMVEFFGKNL